MLNFRLVDQSDLELLFAWSNDNLVRQQSFNSNIIEFENHKKWFELKLKDKFCIIYIFQNEEGSNIGQVRIQMDNDNQALIGVSVAAEHRGKGYAKEMLKLATDYFLKKNGHYIINAYIKESNRYSKFAFEKAGFNLIEMVNYEGFLSYHYTRKKI
jgi:RimJ/RimL family protein N-acetyltransferase